MSDYSSFLAPDAPVGFTDPDTGKSYPVGLLTQERKTSFEAWLKSRALAALEDVKPLLSAAEWEQERRAFREELSAGRYAFFGPVAEMSRGTADGGAKMASLLMGIPTDEVFEVAARHGDLLKAALDAAIAASTPRRKAPADGEVPEGKAPSPA